MKGRITAEALLLLVFFGVLALFFSRPLFLISDFWWHLNSGRWIFEHAAFPAADPFSLLPHPEAGFREALVLKGYWLAQVLYFQVYRLAGLAGAVALKAGILTAVVAIVWLLLKRREVPSPWRLLLLMPLAIYLREYDELRPHLLSFFCFALLLLLLERYRQALAEGRAGWGDAVGIVMLMAMWANLHTGFIVGVGLTGLFVLVEIGRLLTKRDPLPAGRLKALAAVGGVAMLAPLCNPNGVLLYRVLLMEGVAGKFGEITEYAPVWRYFARIGESHFVYLLVIVLCTALLCGVINRRKAPVTEWLLLVVFAVAGFSQFRYSLFFMMIATLVIGRSLAQIPMLTGRKVSAVGQGAVLAGALLLAVISWPKSALARGPARLDPAERAVVYLEANRLPGPLFSPYEWGGYLQWTLTPEYRLFVDPRAIDYAHYADYREAVQGRKARVFEKYGFNTVIFYLYPPYLEQIPSLIFSLLRDNDWRLRYAEGGAVIFVRAAVDRGRDALDKGRFMTVLAETLAEKSRLAPGRVEYLLDLGQLRYIQGDTAGARAFFVEALRRDPRNEFATAWLKHLEEGV